MVSATPKAVVAMIISDIDRVESDSLGREVPPERREREQRRRKAGQRGATCGDGDGWTQHLLIVKEAVVEQSRQQRTERQAAQVEQQQHDRRYGAAHLVRKNHLDGCER